MTSIVWLLWGCGAPTARNTVESREVYAEPLDTTYTVTVYVPPELEGASGAPWLLVLDGEWGQSEANISDRLIVRGDAAPHVLVGIGNSSVRGRDYSPTDPDPDDEYESGGLDAFVSWLQGELIPDIEAELDIGGEPALRGLHGHSYGGLATATAMLRYQDTWTRFGATSPSLFWDDAVIFAFEEDYAATNSDLPVRAYLGIGALEVPPMNVLFEVFTERLDGRGYPGLALEHEVLRNREHFSSWERAYARLIPHLFPPEG